MRARFLGACVVRVCAPVFGLCASVLDLQMDVHVLRVHVVKAISYRSTVKQCCASGGIPPSFEKFPPSFEKFPNWGGSFPLLLDGKISNFSPAAG